MQRRSASNVIEEQKWLDAPAIALQHMVDRSYHSLGRAEDKVHRALHGDWLGYALHPGIVVAPIGAFTTAVALDAIDGVRPNEGMDKAAEACIALGLATSIVAAATGATEWHNMRDPNLRRVGLVHATMNTVALGCYGASLLVRRARSKKAGKFLALIGLAVITGSGFLGGHMVYHRRAGIR
jgi:uncharacterized membrane protein